MLKKNNIFAGIHNGTPEYALKMINKGFNFVTIGSDQRAIECRLKKCCRKNERFFKDGRV